MARIGITLAAVALAITGLAGCTTTIAGTGAPQGASQAEAPSDQGASAAPDVDVCSLIPAATVTKLIGANDGGTINEFSFDQKSSTCTWKSIGKDGVLVLLQVGLRGTAPGGALPPIAQGNEDFYAPLPDGMRQYGVDKVEFVAGDRFCAVRVSSGPRGIEGGKDPKSAVGLAKDIRGRL